MKFLKEWYINSKKNAKYYYLMKLHPSRYEDFLKKEYVKRTGEVLNLEKPQKFTEKMQYAKLHLSSPQKTRLSDKYEVREWVAEQIGTEYLVPLLGVWDSAEEINFDLLPQKFILKVNSGSGTNIVVKNKDNLDKNKAIRQLNYWTRRDFGYDGDLQLHYVDIKTKIIAEKYIKPQNKPLIDYRFICFNGEVHFCWLDFYTDDGRHHYSNIYDTNWELQPWRFEPMQNTPNEIRKPKNFDKMLFIAKKLSQGFSHVRVDLYNIEGKIYFGEMTFTSTGGFRLITPEKYNFMLGNLWNISDEIKK